MSNHVHNINQFDGHFWNAPNSWPHDPPGYVFLARAFNEIGQAKYGTRWIESPEELEDPGDPPDDADYAAWHRNEIAYEQYERACNQPKADFQSMRADVARTIAHQSEVGNLVTAVRPKSGGAMVGLELYFWNTENFWPRFSHCDMSLNDPFADSRFHRSQWIYVTRDSLDKYLGKVPAINEVAPPDAREAPSQADAVSTSQPAKPSLRPPGTKEIKATLQHILPAPAVIPNDNDTYHLVKEHLPNVKRQRVRDVLAEPEFATRQRQRGNQPKR